MKLAMDNGIRSIAFPSISTGVYSFPVELAAKIAVHTVNRFLQDKKKTIECIEYLSVSAPLDKVDRLEDKQSKYIHEYVKNKEYMIVGTERRHGFSQNDVDRQWHQIVDKIRKKQVDGVIVANMSVITDNLIDAFIKVAQVQAAGGIIVTVDDGRLAMQLRGF